MNERHPQSLAQIMAGSQRLQALDQARQTRATWTEAARKWLPSDIGAHLVAASLQDGVLILSFDSSAWAARSRYVEREVLSAAGDAAIKAVKVRVHPRGGRLSRGRVSGDK
jgi:predicted nucleic acid-binding Zn ribbon protein